MPITHGPHKVSATISTKITLTVGLRDQNIGLAFVGSIVRQTPVQVSVLLDSGHHPHLSPVKV
jgi:hypothetical protein